MRPITYIMVSAILLVSSAKTITGQSTRFNFYSYDRQIGPIERALQIPYDLSKDSHVKKSSFGLTAQFPEQPSIIWPVLGGLAGTVIGAGIGLAMIAGPVSVEYQSTPEQSHATGIVIALAMLPTFTSMGVHIGNRSLGNFGLTTLVSYLSVGAGVIVSTAHIFNPWIIPVVQLIGTVAAERVTAARNLRKR